MTSDLRPVTLIPGVLVAAEDCEAVLGVVWLLGILAADDEEVLDGMSFLALVLPEAEFMLLNLGRVGIGEAAVKLLPHEDHFPGPVMESTARSIFPVGKEAVELILDPNGEGPNPLIESILVALSLALEQASGQATLVTAFVFTLSIGVHFREFRLLVDFGRHVDTLLELVEVLKDVKPKDLDASIHFLGVGRQMEAPPLVDSCARGLARCILRQAAARSVSGLFCP